MGLKRERGRSCEEAIRSTQTQHRHRRRHRRRRLRGHPMGCRGAGRASGSLSLLRWSGRVGRVGLPQPNPTQPGPVTICPSGVEWDWPLTVTCFVSVQRSRCSGPPWPVRCTPVLVCMRACVAKHKHKQHKQQRENSSSSSSSTDGDGEGHEHEHGNTATCHLRPMSE